MGQYSTAIYMRCSQNPARQFYDKLGGRPVYEKTVTMGGVPLMEVAYGWREAHILLAPSQ